MTRRIFISCIITVFPGNYQGSNPSLGPKWRASTLAGHHFSYGLYWLFSSTYVLQSWRERVPSSTYLKMQTIGKLMKCYSKKLDSTSITIFNQLLQTDFFAVVLVRSRFVSYKAVFVFLTTFFTLLGRMYLSLVENEIHLDWSQVLSGSPNYTDYNNETSATKIFFPSWKITVVSELLTQQAQKSPTVAIFALQNKLHPIAHFCPDFLQFLKRWNVLQNHPRL